MKRCYCGLLGWIAIVSSFVFAVPQADQSNTEFSSPSAQAAQKAYKQAMEDARQQYQLQVDKVIQEYCDALQAACKKEVDADNLKEAMRIKAEIQRFSFDLKKGLVLYLPFEKTAESSKVVDASGSKNLIKVEGAVWTPDGAVGGAYQFDIKRKTDRIVVANSEALNSKAITISVWVKTDDNDEYWNRIIDKNWKRGFCLSTGGDDKGKQYRGRVNFDAGEGVFIMSEKSISDNSWHHIIAQHDGETMTLFIDGIKQKAQKKAPQGVPLNTYHIGIGNAHPGYNDVVEFLAFNGGIDELRVYNRPLSEREIAVLYEQGQF
jgi:hypothetical protein